MKSERLQLHDYILSSNNEIREVIRVGTNKKVEVMDLKTHLHCEVNEDELNPILLTGKILQNNGFYCIYDYWGEPSWYNDDKDIVLEENPNSKFYIKVMQNFVDINYVHDFQQYLRILGYNEFANNLNLTDDIH